MKKRMLKYFFILGLISLSFSSCASSRPDVLDDLGQSVLKTRHGIEIDIKPESP